MPARRNKRWECFCQEYLVDLNATQAYLRAGYSARRENAHDHGARLMSHSAILDRIAELQAARLRRIEVQQDNVIEELRRVAFSNLRDVAEWGPGYLRLKASSELPPEVSAAIKKIRVTKDGISIELHDKLQALLKLADHLGMVTRTKLIGDADAPLRVLIVRSLDELPES